MEISYFILLLLAFMFASLFSSFHLTESIHLFLCAAFFYIVIIKHFIPFFRNFSNLHSDSNWGLQLRLKESVSNLYASFFSGAFLIQKSNICIRRMKARKPKKATDDEKRLSSGDDVSGFFIHCNHIINISFDLPISIHETSVED